MNVNEFRWQSSPMNLFVFSGCQTTIFVVVHLTKLEGKLLIIIEYKTLPAYLKIAKCSLAMVGGQHCLTSV